MSEKKQSLTVNWTQRGVILHWQVPRLWRKNQNTHSKTIELSEVICKWWWDDHTLKMIIRPAYIWKVIIYFLLFTIYMLYRVSGGREVLWSWWSQLAGT